MSLISQVNSCGKKIGVVFYVSEMFYSLFNNVKGKTNVADFTQRKQRLSFEVFHYLKHQEGRSGPVNGMAKWVLPCRTLLGLR
jgi:hypothetical protein